MLYWSKSAPATPNTSVATPPTCTQVPPLTKVLSWEIPTAGGSVDKAKPIGGSELVDLAVAGAIGAGVCPGKVGAGLLVGDEVVGTPVGFCDGLLEGGSDASGVGAALGVVVGEEVPLAVQLLLPAFTHSGVNESNCCNVSNTEANPHKSPVLFVSKLSTLLKEFPKTPTLETPTSLLRKQVFAIVNGPKVSIIKLFVVDWRLNETW